MMSRGMRQVLDYVQALTQRLARRGRAHCAGLGYALLLLAATAALLRPGYVGAACCAAQRRRFATF
jgi:hypothetical protein